MKEKFIFRIKFFRIEILVSKGEIISIDSNSSKYGMNHLKETLEILAKENLEEFINLHKSLFFSSKYYKITKKILEERRKELMKDVSKIDYILPQKMEYTKY